ncbi:glycerophosphodiester phosphodiesterase family protein [Mammaliicoccus fleurettii]|nr:glycerophosphodiester phosphodiesterase family protein [Mammaliicoccus fleurettii]
MVTKKFVDEAHKVNMKVMPYTINDDETVRKMINLNVDGIITDYPQKIEKWLET